MSDDEGFLSRWSRRKALVREGKVAPPEPVLPPPVVPVARSAPLPVAPAMEPPAPERPPAPTLDDVQQLTRSSDYTRFVAPDVDPQVKNAALKKLFTDPQFNVMDGLDVYIDDYGKPDPIPASMLRQMVQSRALGLFDDEEEDEARRRQAVAPGERADPDGGAVSDAAPSTTDESRAQPPHDPDPAVRLQPDDAAGPAGPGPGPGQDAGRER